MIFFILWILFISIFTYILTSCDIIIHFLIGLIFTSQQCFSQSTLSGYPLSHRHIVLTLSIGLRSFLHSEMTHDEVIKWNHFPYYRPFVRGIHQSLVDSLHKSQQCGTFILYFFFMSAQTNCSTNIHLTSDLRWWCSCDISIMNSWNNTPQWKKGEMLRFRPLLYLLKWTRALPETKKYMCETHSDPGPEISFHYQVDGSLELYLRTRASALLQWK